MKVILKNLKRPYMVWVITGTNNSIKNLIKTTPSTVGSFVVDGRKFDIVGGSRQTEINFAYNDGCGNKGTAYGNVIICLDDNGSYKTLEESDILDIFKLLRK